MAINYHNHNINTSGTITSPSGNFTTLIVNGTSVSNFNSSVSGLLPTIANSGDNRILTSTGSSVGINAESNLTFDGTNLNLNNQTASTIASFDSSKNLVSLATATYPSLTELSYVKGVTSAIQTQIDTKAATSTTITAGSGLAGGGSLAANRTIDIGQGDGITVSADSIAVDSTVIRTTGVQTMSGAKTFSTQTVFSSGTAAAPGISILGDTDTGLCQISSVGTNSLSISTSGVERVRFASNGDVQINTGRTISGGTGGALFGNNGINNDFISTGRAAALSAGWATLRVNQVAAYVGLRLVGDTSQTASYMEVENSSGTNLFTINSAGSVGIGTSSPTQSLQVHGSSGDDVYLRISNIDTTTASGLLIGLMGTEDAVIRVEPNKALTFGTNNTERMRITSAGDVGIGTSDPLRRLTITGGGFAFVESGGASRSIHWGNTDNTFPVTIGGVATSGNCYLNFNTNTFGNAATERMRIDSAGRVGIGVTPATAGSSALQVRGDLDIFGNASDRSITYNVGVGDDGITGWYRGKIAFIPSSATNKISTHIAFFNKDGDNGGSTLTERMRITSDGSVGIGTTSVSSGFKVDIRGRVLSYTTASDGLITAQGLQTESAGTGKAAIQIDVNGKGGFAWQNDASSGTRSLKLIENAGYGASESTLLTIQSGGNIGLGASPVNDYKLFANGGIRADSSSASFPAILTLKSFTNTGFGAGLVPTVYSYTTTNGSYSITNFEGNIYHKIDSGRSNSASAISITNNNLRNYGLTNDAGSLGALFGIYNQYGHYNTSAVSPTTTTVIGIQNMLWRATGTITNAFDIYCQDVSSGATVTNRWGIYVEHTGKNYFAGNTGIGVSPTYRFEVRGVGATSSTVSFYISNSSATALLYTRDDGAINTGTAAVSPYNNVTATAANMVVSSDGFLYRSTSSLRYKTQINDATHGLNEVLKLRSVTFKSQNDGNQIFGGLIAEEVDSAGLTEFVQYDNENRPDAIHYSNMVALLIKAIQEQQTQINELKNRLSALEGE